MSLTLGPRDARYIVPPLVASGIAGWASEISPYALQTALIQGVEGDIVSLFQTMIHPVATQLFVAIYLVVYPLLLLFTYIGLKREGRGRHVDYATTYTAVVVASTPLFFLFPVGVTGYHLDSVTPLLYEGNGPVQSFMMTADTLQKAMPSLHAGLAGTASLYAPEDYELVSWATTALILVSTLYLGIHWMSDLVVGIAIAYGCYVATPAIQSRLLHLRESSTPETVHGD